MSVELRLDGFYRKEAARLNALADSAKSSYVRERLRAVARQRAHEAELIYDEVERSFRQEQSQNSTR